MQSTLTSEIWPVTRHSIFSKILIVVFCTLLLALSAKIQVPLKVPVTMQTFVVLVLGSMLGSRLAFATGALYLLEGAVGLPVFATGAGIAYLVGPTGGYLIGFVIAMVLMGKLAEYGWDRNVVKMLAAMLIGESIIFGFGVGWLSTMVGVTKAVNLGLTPFLLSESFKIVLAVVSVPIAWKLLKK